MEIFSQHALKLMVLIALLGSVATYKLAKKLRPGLGGTIAALLLSFPLVILISISILLFWAISNLGISFFEISTKDVSGFLAFFAESGVEYGILAIVAAPISVVISRMQK